jgi:replication factor A1
VESDIEKHVEDMYGVLGGKVERDVLRSDMELYVNQYRVSIPSAKRSIVKRYGGDPDALSIGVEKSIAEIAAGENGVDTSGRVVYAEKREIEIDGKKRVLLSGMLEDATGGIPFTIWDFAGPDISRGDLISIRNAYTTVYRERPQLNISSRSRVWVREKIEQWTRQPKKISEISGNEMDATFVGKIVSWNKKRIMSKGKEIEIGYGLVGDETKTVRFTAWKDFSLAKGDVVSISGAYTREREGEVQVNLSERTEIKKMEGYAIPSVARFGEPRKCTIAELRDGMGNVTVSGRIVRVERKEIMHNGQAVTMFSGLLADGTGKIAFTGWRDFAFTEGQDVRISGAYVRAWKGIPQLKFDEKSEVAAAEEEIKLQDGGSIPQEIGALAERGGAVEANVRSTVIEVRQGTGLVLRCPQCSRTLRAGECRTHGAVQGFPDFRIRLIVDDGTGSLTVNMPRELSEKITGMTLEEIRKRAETTLNQDAVIADITSKLLFSRLRLSGNVSADDFGLSMSCKSAEFENGEIIDEAAALYQEVIQSLGM